MNWPSNEHHKLQTLLAVSSPQNSRIILGVPISLQLGIWFKKAAKGLKEEKLHPPNIGCVRFLGEKESMISYDFIWFHDVCGQKLNKLVDYMNYMNIITSFSPWAWQRITRSPNVAIAGCLPKQVSLALGCSLRWENHGKPIRTHPIFQKMVRINPSINPYINLSQFHFYPWADGITQMFDNIWQYLMIVDNRWWYLMMFGSCRYGGFLKWA